MRVEESTRARAPHDGVERREKVREIEREMHGMLKDGRWKKVEERWLREDEGWSGDPARSR